ncbi:MAG: hypothetical protein HGB35_00105 [Geobacteraceae bacterium]|nr:hypothetical protein [Geobacteraceae bacterium]
MKHIVKFSGGAASAVVAKLVIEQFGHDVIRGITLRKVKEMSDQEISMFPDEDTTPCMCAL